MSFVNVQGGSVIAPSYIAFLAYNLPTNTQLVMNWPSQFVDNPNNVASIMAITAGVAGGTPCAIILPDATAVSPGQTSLILNLPSLGSNSFEVLLHDGVTVLVTIPAGASYYIILTDNTTSNGTWIVTTIPGSPTVTSISAVSTSPDLVITGSPITSVGTFTFSLARDLAAIAGLAATGIAVRTNSVVPAWTTRSITSSSGSLAITNANGVAGNIDINVAASLTLTSLIAGDISIGVVDAHTISTTDANGNINLTPNGTGAVNVNTSLILPNVTATDFSYPLAFYGSAGFTAFVAGNQGGTNNQFVWPTVAPLAGQVLGIQTAGSPNLLEWNTVVTSPGATTPNAVAVYLNAGGALQNSPIIVGGLPAQAHLTGINSIEIATIASAQGLLLNVVSNTIATRSGALILSANGASLTQVSNGLQILSGGSSINGTILYSTSASPALSFTLPNAVPAANNAVMVSSTAGVLSLSPKTTSGVAAAFINFNGTGATVNSAYNCNLSVGAGGTNTLTFPIPFADTNYAVVGSVGSGAASAFLTYDTKTTGSIIIYTTNSTFALTSYTDVSVAFYAV